MRRRKAGEFELIRRHLAPLAAGIERTALGLEDDAARLIAPRAGQLVVTADALVAGVHFLADDPPGLIARKALRVNLSDLAGKGARPWLYFLCVAWPRRTPEATIAAFAAGLAADQRRYGITLAGGDTTSTPGPLTIAVTALGIARRMVRRQGAREGDEIWVTGTIGDGALGLLAATGRLAALAPRHRAALARRYRLPQPRTALAPALAGLARAAMDVSDGLVQDLGHLARLAGLGATIEEDAVPLSAAARAAIATAPRLLDRALGGGDDYEILMAVPRARGAALVAAAARAGVRVTRIGRFHRGSGVALRDRAGRARRLARGGWTHF